MDLKTFISKILSNPIQGEALSYGNPSERIAVRTKFGVVEAIAGNTIASSSVLVFETPQGYYVFSGTAPTITRKQREEFVKIRPRGSIVPLVEELLKIQVLYWDGISSVFIGGDRPTTQIEDGVIACGGITNLGDKNYNAVYGDANLGDEIELISNLELLPPAVELTDYVWVGAGYLQSLPVVEEITPVETIVNTGSALPASILPTYPKVSPPPIGIYQGSKTVDRAIPNKLESEEIATWDWRQILSGNSNTPLPTPTAAQQISTQCSFFSVGAYFEYEYIRLNRFNYSKTIETIEQLTATSALNQFSFIASQDTEVSYSETIVRSPSSFTTVSGYVCTQTGGISGSPFGLYQWQPVGVVQGYYNGETETITINSASSKNLSSFVLLGTFFNPETGLDELIQSEYKDIELIDSDRLDTIQYPSKTWSVPLNIYYFAFPVDGTFTRVKTESRVVDRLIPSTLLIERENNYLLYRSQIESYTENLTHNFTYNVLKTLWDNTQTFNNRVNDVEVLQVSNKTIEDKFLLLENAETIEISTVNSFVVRFKGDVEFDGLGMATIANTDLSPLITAPVQTFSNYTRTKNFLTSTTTYSGTTAIDNPLWDALDNRIVYLFKRDGDICFLYEVEIEDYQYIDVFSIPVTLTNGSNTATTTDNGFKSVLEKDTVVGNGISNWTTVQSLIDNNTIVLSKNATFTGTTNLTFSSVGDNPEIVRRVEAIELKLLSLVEFPYFTDLVEDGEGIISPIDNANAIVFELLKTRRQYCNLIERTFIYCEIPRSRLEETEQYPIVFEVNDSIATQLEIEPLAFEPVSLLDTDIVVGISASI